MANDGNIDLGDLNLIEETPFLLDGSLEPPQSLPLFALAASGTAGAVLSAYAPGLHLPAFSLTEAASADGAILPAFSLDAQGDAGNYISGRLALLAPELAGSLEAALALPAWQLAGTASGGQVLAAPLLALAPLQLAATGSSQDQLALSAYEVDGSMLAGSVGTGSVVVLPWSGGASSLQDTVAEGMVTFALLQLDASGGADALIEGSVSLSPPRLEALAGTGQLASAALTVPLFALAADGHQQAIGSATLTLPAFEIAGAGAAVGTAPVPVARPLATAIVLNTRLKGVVRYEGLAANSFAQFAGMQLAATPDGIVALMGDTDLGAPIAASVRSGTSDLGMTERKRIEAAFVGYRCGGEMEMTLITDEHHEYTYRMVPRQIPDAIHATRVKFGRGVDGRYWQWSIANTDGGAFDLANMQLNVLPLSRSV